MEFYFNPETGRVEQRAPVNTTGIAGMYDQVYGDLVDQTNAQPNVLGAPMTMDEIMYGSVLNKFPNNINVNQTADIMQQEPTIPMGIFTDDAGLEEESYEEFPEVKQEPRGIAKLFEFLGNIPTPFNLVRRGLGSLRGLNDRIQGSDFGQATSLMDYLDMRKYGGAQGRRDAAARNMAQARGITKSLASRPSSTSGGYQQGPGGSGNQATGASQAQSNAGPGFSGSGSAAEMGSF